jgi:hypothetical protein
MGYKVKRSLVNGAAMRLIGAVLLLLGAAAAPAAAQAPPRKNVISANPFGLLLGLANAEYERAVSESSTVGIGGSMYDADNDDYVNTDVFWRYYPNGRPTEGWAFGAKAGLTHLLDAGTRFGYGFDVNHSWVMGKKHNFYVGIGFGLKRLVGGDDVEFDLKYIPTIRIINIGWAF